MYQICQQYFKDNYDVLKPIFLERKKIGDIDSVEEIQNIHNAYINEFQIKFSEAMKKDHLYKKATAFMNDGQIWLLKVLKIYFVTQVLRFSYDDFIKAVENDLPPIFSNVGLWIMETWLS